MPDTVQTATRSTYVLRHHMLKPSPETRTVIQPKGRIAAQVGHVVSKMRMHRYARLYHEWAKALEGNKVKLAEKLSECIEMEPDNAYTTIILGVPDSYQLEFRHYLLAQLGLRVHCFYDSNPEYGAQTIKTAICTEPVAVTELFGATDYLELWK